MKNKIIIALIALILILVVAFSLTTCLFFSSNFLTPTVPTIDKNDSNQNEQIDYYDTFGLIHALFNNFSIFDVDYETAVLSAIRAYVEATGDKYAMYYTPEELEVLTAENNGDLYGIGVQVIFDYTEYFMEIVLIMPNSPAETHLQVGDKVTHICVNDEKLNLVDIVAENKLKLKEIYPMFDDEQINDLACYEAFQYAVSNLKGPEGTFAKFTVNRNGESLDMEIQRAKVKTLSVTYKKSIKDSSIGIVSISEFDYTTPPQFKDAMDALISNGCTKFVFDLRNNGGGNLASLAAVVCTFLNEGDIIYTTKDYSGTVEETKATVVNYGNSSNFSTCNITKSDIGKYQGYEYVVLVNENTASSAEIFTAVFRDYNLSPIVGMNTYGKGSVQSIVTLQSYGPDYEGALKFTTRLNFPPCGVGYDGGIGIAPDYEVQLEGIALETHFYKLTEEIDNQLQKAISILIN